VLDIDRDRQRISLGLKQTQEDPWQRIVNTYNIGDELAGTVTKVVTFGAFVEILDGVEGLVHISELAAHHVENPREIVQPGDELRVKILEIDSERRRLSLSAKRVEGQVLPVRRIEPEQPSEAADAQPAADGDAEPAPDATADEAPQAEAELAEAAQPAADEAGGATEALDEIEPAAEVVPEPVVVAPEPVAVAEVAEETVTADEPEAVIEAPTQDADTPASPQAAESTGPQVVEQPGGDDDAAEQQPSAAE
jgi:small subunit ribosomal protein S1